MRPGSEIYYDAFSLYINSNKFSGFVNNDTTLAHII